MSSTSHPGLPVPILTDLIPAEPGPRAARASRIGLFAFVAGLAGFLAWAVFAPLDEGVVAPGSVTVDTKSKTVQHLSGGIVQEVLVREGQSVQEGQVLLRLDTGSARANFEAARQRYFALRAAEGRLLAEQAGARKIVWHPDLEEEGGKDPMIRQQMAMQQQLLATRGAALQADLAAVEENIRGQQGLITAYRSMLENRIVQSGLVDEQLRNLRALVSDGFAPRTRQLELERLLAEAMTAQLEMQGSIVRAQQSIAELRQRAIALEQNHRREVETQRTEVAREVLAESARYAALRDDLARMEIRSPATGQVVGLAIQTAGGVIAPGQKLMDVVPGDALLLLEARVPPHVIDRVRTGLPVDIRFSNFSHTPTLVVGGEVVSISADLLVEPTTQSSHYLARVVVTPEGLAQLGARRMQPGMPAEVVIRTGERPLLAYLAGPLVKRVATAMTEE